LTRRIWELDAARGLCVIGMVFVHLIYNAAVLFRLIPGALPLLFRVVQYGGGIAFLLISGICATLGSRSVRRGCIVFGCGMVYTAATAACFLLGFADKDFLIWFGVLHCLGICMILWRLFRELSPGKLAIIGVLVILSGILVQDVTVKSYLLLPLGLTPAGFATPDYFPLLPNLGYFLLGAVIGKVLYAKKESLLPKVNTERFPVSFLLLCGRHSLIIYLLHQPILLVILSLIP
jgi:uncharacterized membrane protein